VIQNALLDGPHALRVVKVGLGGDVSDQQQSRPEREQVENDQHGPDERRARHEPVRPLVDDLGAPVDRNGDDVADGDGVPANVDDQGGADHRRAERPLPLPVDADDEQVMDNDEDDFGGGHTDDQHVLAMT